jgi:hypothetical protein
MVFHFGQIFTFFWPEKYDFYTYKGFLWKNGLNLQDLKNNNFTSPDFHYSTDFIK